MHNIIIKPQYFQAASEKVKINTSCKLLNMGHHMKVFKLEHIDDN